MHIKTIIRREHGHKLVRISVLLHQLPSTERWLELLLLMVHTGISPTVRNNKSFFLPTTICMLLYFPSAHRSPKLQSAEQPSPTLLIPAQSLLGQPTPLDECWGAEEQIWDLHGNSQPETYFRIYCITSSWWQNIFQKFLFNINQINSKESVSAKSTNSPSSSFSPADKHCFSKSLTRDEADTWVFKYFGYQCLLQTKRVFQKAKFHSLSRAWCLQKTCRAPHQKETRRDGDEQKSTAEWEHCHQATRK